MPMEKQSATGWTLEVHELVAALEKGVRTARHLSLLVAELAARLDKAGVPNPDDDTAREHMRVFDLADEFMAEARALAIRAALSRTSPAE